MKLYYRDIIYSYKKICVLPKKYLLCPNGKMKNLWDAVFPESHLARRNKQNAQRGEWLTKANHPTPRFQARN